MITFKTFLQERAFNSREYKKVLGRLEGALVGFEVETIVSRQSPYFTDNSREPAETVDISNFDTLDEFQEYFDIHGKAELAIERDHAKWLEEKREEFIEENWENEYDDSSDDSDEAEQAARELAGEKFDESPPEWSEWFEDTYSSAWDFVSEYGLDPTYGWYEEGHIIYTSEHDEDEDDDNYDINVAEDIAFDLAKEIGSRVIAHSDTHVEDSKKWAIVPDTSISDSDEKVIGIEIVSPPQPPEKAISDLRALFNFMKKNKLVTNSSTGLHVNLSIPNIQDLDMLKLVLFMGDEHVLKQFDRQDNKYTTSQRQAIISSIRDRGMVPKDAKELMNLAQHILIRRGKYSSVNLTKISSGYLEFRAAGGEGYHLQFEKVNEIIGRWLSALEIACDRNLERTTYMKKVTKLLNTVPNSDANNIAEMPLIDALSKYDGIATTLAKDDISKSNFIKMFALVASYVGGKMKPTLRQAKEIRDLLRKNQVTVKMISDYAESKQNDVVGGVNLPEYEKFMKAFKLM